MARLYEMFIKKTEVLTHALEKANERCRFMLYVITLGSILMLVVTFNNYWSWDRKLNAKERILLSEELGMVSPWQFKKYNLMLAEELGYQNKDSFCANVAKIVLDFDRKIQGGKPMKDKLKVEVALSHYFDSLYKSNLLIDKSNYFEVFYKHQTFNIPLIGLSCSASDLFLLGSFFILILLIYAYYNLRREERILFRIFKYLKFIAKNNINKTLGIRTMDKYEQLNVQYNALEIIFQGAINSFVFTTILSDKDYWTNNKHKSNKFANVIKRYIDFLPVISLFLLLALDIYSFCMRFVYFNYIDIIECIIKYGFGLFLFIACVFQCCIIYRINRNSEVILEDMYKVITSKRNELRDFNEDDIDN